MRDGKVVKQLMEDCQIPLTAIYDKKIKDLETYYKKEIKHWRLSFMSCFIALLLVSLIAIAAIVTILKFIC